jgi:hypothetical protein
MGTQALLRTVRVSLGALALVGLAWLLLAHALPAGAGGNVTTCNEASLRAALAGGGSVTFGCGASPAPITLTSPLVITAPTSLDGTNGGSPITLSGGGTTRV